MPTNLEGTQLAAAMHGLAMNPAIPLKDKLSLALQALDMYEAEVKRLRKVSIHFPEVTGTQPQCSCNGPPHYDGPSAECAIHGVIPAFNEAMQDIENLKRELIHARSDERARVALEIRKLTKQYEQTLTAGLLSPIAAINLIAAMVLEKRTTNG